MRNEFSSSEGIADPLSGGPGELNTEFAPPFRALLSNSADSLSIDAESGPLVNESSTTLPAVPGYEILAELGRGGMGVVYLARQCSLKRCVALKMILSGPHASPTARARFRTEAEAAAQLQHPNIVQVYEIGEHEGRPFLSLEYVEGGSLAKKIAGRPQPQPEAARLVEILARAVHYSHQRGILHRDLKPANILLQERFAAEDPDERRDTAESSLPLHSSASSAGKSLLPKITDFGLAKFVDQGGPTRSETLLGTPNYMPPEQAAGQAKRIGVAADVYSLGAILYELLTGRPPFCGTSALDILEQVRKQDPVPPRRWCSHVTRDLETICLRCLEKEPENRYPSALALASDLRRFLHGEPIQARPASLRQRLWKSARRRGLLAKAISAVAVLCVLLTCGWYFRVADQLAEHHAQARYVKFLERRSDALFYGLLAPEQHGLFAGSEATAHIKRGESAAREALALAGVNANTASATIDPSFSAPRRSELATDCYELLLLLAGFRTQRALPEKAKQERCREALQLLDTARKLGIASRAYHLRRADILDQAGHQDEAREEREQARSLPLSSALDDFLIGEDLYRRGDWEGAKCAFDHTLHREPSHFWARFFLSVCHLKLQQWEAAKAGLNACLAQQPDFIWIYLYRSFANEKLQAFHDAETDFDKALQLNPNQDARYFLLLSRGILHFNQAALERAAEDFRRAVALKPDQYNAYLNLAYVSLAQGEFQQAAEQAGKARQLEPPPEAVLGYHIERGRNLLRHTRYEQALEACDAACDLASDHPPALLLRGRAFLALERYEEAEQAFDRYLQCGGEALPDVFVGRGRARMQLGKYPDAAEDYTRALEEAPDAPLYQHRGWAYFFSEAWKLALRDFSKAIDLDPTVSDAYTGRGLATVMLGDYRAAVADAEEACRRKVDSPEMMHNIACIYAQAVAHAEKNPNKDSQALMENYRRRAVEAVHQTLNMLDPENRLSFWRDKILPDTALIPIRSDARFKRLEEEAVRPLQSGRTR